MNTIEELDENMITVWMACGESMQTQWGRMTALEWAKKDAARMREAGGDAEVCYRQTPTGDVLCGITKEAQQ